VEHPNLPIVQVDSLYYNGSLNKRWRSYRLATEPGRVVQVRAKGSPLYSGKGKIWMPEGPAIEIYPLDDWYNFHYLFDGSGTLESYYINIALPPTFKPGALIYVDLDLDAHVQPDFHYTVYDEEDFTSHAGIWAIPSEVCARAQQTLLRVIEMVQKRDPIFSEWEHYLPLVPPGFVTTTSGALFVPKE
jgi:protein associated with RNAse G/E